MLRRLIRAFAAISASLVMCLSAPALALAHGHVHHELGEYSAAMHHLPAGENPLTVVEHTVADGHGHPVIYPGLLSRFAPLLPALLSKQATLVDLSAGRTLTSVVPPVPFQAPPDPVSTRPQQPRAPPAL